MPANAVKEFASPAKFAGQIFEEKLRNFGQIAASALGSRAQSHPEPRADQNFSEGAIFFFFKLCP